MTPITEYDFEQIDTIIGWYQGLDKGFNDIDHLIYSRRKLSGLLVRLASYVGRLAKDAEAAEGKRKIKAHSLCQRYIDEGFSASAADKKAESEIAEERKVEKDYIGRFKSGRLLYDSINQCLNSMAGEINYLREEKVSVNHRQTT